MLMNKQDAKLHYKMYKSGKRWVYAGLFAVAISGIAVSATVLNPIAPVQATSADTGYKYTGSNDSQVVDQVQKGVADGTVVDLTKTGSSTVQLLQGQVAEIRAAHMKLTLDGNNWSISAADDQAKTDLDTVLNDIGFPSAAALSNPTDLRMRPRFLRT
ncbi:KxYKxGKxW signal peptide domain-containing protein [Lacticaseibacillus sharpeae]|uniref:KxYKxGKxW signal peptide domain-containing protein n=1 Tax=Lacticaseibacillus sharpeae TaxID=1626 RepID=UPI0006D15A37|nr:KxYKxGKxW signal peptide domain-containing protein [Lacticaseibacillus sharpeae]